MGYDPIFRQQTIGQSENTIQPAPGSLPPSPPPAGATCAYTNPSLTQASGPRLCNSYGSQPAILSSVYASSSAAPSPSSSSIPTGASLSYHTSPIKDDGNSDYSSVKIDTAFDFSGAGVDPAIRHLPPTPASVDARHLDQKTGQLIEGHYPRGSVARVFPLGLFVN